jgi:hypothetical protein
MLGYMATTWSTRIGEMATFDPMIKGMQKMGEWK